MHISGSTNRKQAIGGNATYNRSRTSASVTIMPPSNRAQASILPAICKSFGPIYMFGSSLKLIYDLLEFLFPLLLKLLIDFVSAEQTTTGDSSNNAHARDPLWRGVFYAISLFVVASMQSLVLEQCLQRTFTVGLRVRTALIGAIYRKTLCLSNAARKESTVGEIVNLMAVGECFRIRSLSRLSILNDN